MSFEEFLRKHCIVRTKLENCWICPYCGRINSLEITECPYCNK